MQYSVPKVGLEKAMVVLSASLTKEKAYQKILTHLIEHLNAGTPFDNKLFGERLPSELQHSYNKSILFPIPPFSSNELYLREIEKVAKQLCDLYVKERLKVISEQMVAKEKDGTQEEITALKKEYATLLSQLT